MQMDPNTPLPPHIAKIVKDDALLDIYNRLRARGNTDIAVFVSMKGNGLIQGGPRDVVRNIFRSFIKTAPYYAVAIEALEHSAAEAGKLREGFWLIVSSWEVGLLDGNPRVDALALGVFDGKRAS